MHSVLQNLKSVPGVKGGLLADDTGGVIAHSLPDSFALPALQAISSELSYKVWGFQEPTGGIRQFDLRFEHARIVVRVFRNCYLLVMCESSINLQLLSIAMNVAVNKIEKLIQQSPEPLEYLQDEVRTEPEPVAAEAADSPVLKLNRPRTRSEKMLDRFNSEFHG